MLEKLTKSIPLFSATFILFEAVKLVGYYSLFGFNIIPYVTISDLLLFFLYDVSRYVLIMAVYIFVIVLSEMAKEFSERKNKYKLLKHVDGLVFISLSLLSIKILNSTIYITYLILFSFLWGLSKNGMSIIKLYLTAFPKYIKQKHQVEEMVAMINEQKITAATKDVPENLLEQMEQTERKVRIVKASTKQYQLLVDKIFYMMRRLSLKILLLTFLIISINDIAFEYFSYKYKPIYRITELILEDEIIKPRSEIYYIGNTSEYYFVYDEKLLTVRVLKKDRVKEVIQ